MDAFLRRKRLLDQESLTATPIELTCSVHFNNPKYNANDSSGSELNSITLLVSKTEDLELDHVFKRAPQPGSLIATTNRSLFDLGHNFEDVDNWLATKQPSKDALTQVLRYMIEGHEKTTVQIEIDNMYFNCHLAVLQVYSKYFMELQRNPLCIKLHSDKVSQKAFLIIYKWMLSPAPSLQRQHIVEVFKAATYLRIEVLLQHCWNYFDDLNCFYEDTACVLYVEAKDNPSLDIVRNLMLTRINKFLLTFVASSDFLNLPLKHLVFFLNSNAICVNTEIEILFIAVRWLGHDWKKRCGYLPKLVNCVRFKLLPIWYLLCVRKDETNELLGEIVKTHLVDRKLDEAIVHITTTIRNEGIDIETVDPDTLYKGTAQRSWIHDTLCPYTHTMGCPNTREIFYENFLSYLHLLQRQPHGYWATVEYYKFKPQISCCSLKTDVIDEDFETDVNNFDQPLQNLNPLQK